MKRILIGDIGHLSTKEVCKVFELLENIASVFGCAYSIERRNDNILVYLEIGWKCD